MASQGSKGAIALLGSRLKQAVRRGVRGLHARYLDRGLPDRIALLSHGLPARHHPAFREMATYFAQQGYVFTTPGDFLAGHHAKCVLLTFDDCFREWFDALDLFDERSIKVTFYVNTLPLRDIANRDTVARYAERIGVCARTFEPLSTDEVIALRARGHTLGSHSHSHFDLAALSEPRARDEIRTGKAVLEAIVGGRIEHFSYPYGMRRHFTPALRAACHALGFHTVANGIPGHLHGERSRFLHRSLWDFDAPLEHNLQSLRIDGRLFERLTGRSAV